jgi:hypothetical protein
MRGRPPLPAPPAAPIPVVSAVLVAAAAAFVVTRLAGLSGRLTVAYVGLSVALALGWALALAARRSIRVLAAAYLELDQALFASEQTCDRLSLVNEALADANVGLRAAQIAFAELLNLANERSNGQMRALVEETGAELAEILTEQLRTAQRVHD